MRSITTVSPEVFSKTPPTSVKSFELNTSPGVCAAGRTIPSMRTTPTHPSAPTIVVGVLNTPARSRRKYPSNVSCAACTACDARMYAIPRTVAVLRSGSARTAARATSATPEKDRDMPSLCRSLSSRLRHTAMSAAKRSWPCRSIRNVDKGTCSSP